MHTLVKNHLPDEVIHRGKTYIRLIAESAKISLGQKVDTTDCLQVMVISKALKGKTDLHGKPYEASKWLFRLKPEMKALHIITCKYSGPKGLGGSKLILRSDRFRQSKYIAYDSSKQDSLHQGWDWLTANGFKPLGTGEGRNNMYIVCEVLKPLKNDNL